MAAPVEDGTMFWAAALPSRQSFLFGPSTIDWLAVYEWTVLRIAFSTPRASSRIARIGEAAFVVQEAFEVISQVESLSSLIPMRTVAPSTPSTGASFIGAVTTTRLAPASKWALAAA